MIGGNANERPGVLRLSYYKFNQLVADEKKFDTHFVGRTAQEEDEKATTSDPVMSIVKVVVTVAVATETN